MEKDLRIQIDDLVEEFSVKYPNLIHVMVCWISPITGKLDHRQAFFTENFEAALFEEVLEKTYSKLGYTHEVYKF